MRLARPALVGAGSLLLTAAVSGAGAVGATGLAAAGPATLGRPGS